MDTLLSFGNFSYFHWNWFEKIRIFYDLLLLVVIVPLLSKKEGYKESAHKLEGS